MAGFGEGAGATITQVNFDPDDGLLITEAEPNEVEHASAVPVDQEFIEVPKGPVMLWLRGEISLTNLENTESVTVVGTMYGEGEDAGVEFTVENGGVWEEFHKVTWGTRSDADLNPPRIYAWTSDTDNVAAVRNLKLDVYFWGG